MLINTQSVFSASTHEWFLSASLIRFAPFIAAFAKCLVKVDEIDLDSACVLGGYRLETPRGFWVRLRPRVKGGKWCGPAINVIGITPEQEHLTRTGIASMSCQASFRML